MFVSKLAVMQWSRALVNSRRGSLNYMLRIESHVKLGRYICIQQR